MEFKVKSSDLTFRVKKMNAIEALALQTTADLNDVKKTTRCFKDYLERLEVNLDGDKWLPVKESGKEVYYPAGLEDSAKLVKELVDYFLLKYLAPLFIASNTSKTEQE